MPEMKQRNYDRGLADIQKLRFWRSRFNDMDIERIGAHLRGQEHIIFVGMTHRSEVGRRDFMQSTSAKYVLTNERSFEYATSLGTYVMEDLPYNMIDIGPYNSGFITDDFEILFNGRKIVIVPTSDGKELYGHLIELEEKFR